MADSWLRDLRYAYHGLRRSPAFTVTAVLTLACAIGINVGIFATLNAVAFRRLPAPRPHELVRLSTSFRTGQEVPFSSRARRTGSFAACRRSAAMSFRGRSG